MTTVTYALGTPRAAALRGGDCRAYDFNQGRLVHGPHRFAATTHCQISNGLLVLTVGASGVAPTLRLEAWRGAVIYDDYYEDYYLDYYPGLYTTPASLALGSLTIDSPAVSALLTGVRLARITPEAVTVRLIAPLMGDAFVTLRRGERMVRIQHGSTRSPLVTTTRRVRFTASPSPTGTAASKLVYEATPSVASTQRWVGAIDAVTTDAAAFSVTTAALSMARFGAGVGMRWADHDGPSDHLSQLGDASRPRLDVT